MAIENDRKSGIAKSLKDDRGSTALIPHPVIGIVKDNIDPTHGGRIRVYVSRLGGSNPDDAKQWLTVKYMSPWFGLTSANNDVYNSGDKEGYGDYLSVPHSYGFWGSSPSIGTQVICVFINGNPNDGYYIGCAPTIGLTHMVPAIAAAAAVVPNTNETKLYSGADRLPVTEANFSNLEIRNNTEVNNAAKPIHSYQASVLAKQGIVRDNLRGVITSSSQRETPSRVYGMSTPGNSIYEGGYTSANIREAMSSADQSKLQVVGRTGGHSIVMDDGTIDGYDQL
jgi:hypothetical protein